MLCGGLLKAGTSIRISWGAEANFEQLELGWGLEFAEHLPNCVFLFEEEMGAAWRVNTDNGCRSANDLVGTFQVDLASLSYRACKGRVVHIFSGWCRRICSVVGAWQVCAGEDRLNDDRMGKECTNRESTIELSLGDHETYLRRRCKSPWADRMMRSRPVNSVGQGNC